MRYGVFHPHNQEGYAQATVRCWAAM
jgi:hypothetical protein